MSRKDDVEDVFFGKSSEKSFEGWTPECSGSSDQPEKSHGCQSCSNTHLSSMPLSSSSFTFTFCVILNLILCQIPRMDTIDAGMPIFCQAFCSDRRNIDIEDILTWPRLKQRRFTARDIPEMVTYQLRNPSGNIAALSRKPHHNTNTASQPKQQFGLRGIGRLFPIIFFQSSIYICVFVLVCLVSKFSIGHFCKYRSALLYSYLPNWHPSSFSSFIPFESFSEFSITLICCFDDTLHFIYCVHIVCNQS